MEVSHVGRFDNFGKCDEFGKILSNRQIHHFCHCLHFWPPCMTKCLNRLYGFDEIIIQKYFSVKPRTTESTEWNSIELHQSLNKLTETLLFNGPFYSCLLSDPAYEW